MSYFRGVKRAFFHILLAIVILDTTSLNQVLKLPSLVSHFIEHKTLNSEISFLDFLSMHYWGDDLDDNDDDKDMQLPFKKIDLQTAHFLFIPVSGSFSFKTATIWPVKSDYGPDQPQVHYNASLGSLFRPPRA